MTKSQSDLLSAFDGHDVSGIRSALAAGADVRSPIDGKLAVNWLLEEYTRSDRLPECLRLLLEHGGPVDDPLTIPVLLDDFDAVVEMARSRTNLVSHRISLKSAFTSLVDVTLLHAAAEFGNANAVRALLELGADVNAAAGLDEYGLNGHTPLFHTVNSNANRSQPIMQILIDAGASVTARVKGLHWGEGYPWETVFFDVTPISFAQMGLLPQVHRNETDIYANIKTLFASTGESVPPLNNVPNRYLQPKQRG
jgi:hypothetical protein